MLFFNFFYCPSAYIEGFKLEENEGGKVADDIPSEDEEEKSDDDTAAVNQDDDEQPDDANSKKKKTSFYIPRPFLQVTQGQPFIKHSKLIPDF